MGTKKENLLNIPNALTLFRLVLVAVFVYLFLTQQSYYPALTVYCVAALTDFLDGYIARKFNMITNFGKLVDPFADKVLLIASLALFQKEGWIPPFILTFVIIKEITLIAFGVILYKRKIVVCSDWLGKAATVVFNLGIVFSFFSARIYPLNIVFLYIAIVLSIGAFVQYGLKNFQQFLRPNEKTVHRETKS